MTEAAVMSWLDLNTPILPHGKFLSVYNSKISGFTEQSMTKASVVGKITVTLSKFVSHIDRSFPLSIAEGGIGIFGFAVLAFFQIGFPVFVPINLGFRFWCSLRFADFSFFSIRFSVFAKNSDRFLGFDIRYSFRFFLSDRRQPKLQLRDDHLTK